MTHRDNLLRAYRFQAPEWIPISAGLPPMMWSSGYDQSELEDLLLSHPVLFPGYRQGDINPGDPYVPPDMHAGVPYTDGWGCVWQTAYTGMVGSVRNHPLADWDALDTYCAPDPDVSNGMYPLDWPAIRQGADAARAAGALVAGGLPHGHTFLRIQDLRGYENLMFDIADREPRLHRVVDMVEAFNLALVERYLAVQPDLFGIPEDLGMQSAPMISPRAFREYIKPSYLRITAPLKAAGVIVHEHSDGHVLDLVDDLVDCGGDVINLQDLVNGIDHIAACVKGRMAIDLDIDRQSVTVTGSPAEIDAHIREAVMKLGSPAGGLSLCYQPWPPIPIANIRAVFDSMERYCTYWS